jgi:hypothetical protein
MEERVYSQQKSDRQSAKNKQFSERVSSVNIRGLNS